MYWNNDIQLLENDNIGWIVTLDVLKYLIIMKYMYLHISWIVTLDVLKLI